MIDNRSQAQRQHPHITPSTGNIRRPFGMDRRRWGRLLFAPALAFALLAAFWALMLQPTAGAEAAEVDITSPTPVTQVENPLQEERDARSPAGLGSIHYVIPGGSGASCTRVNPCALMTAVINASGGDEIHLGSGTYNTVNGSGGQNQILYVNKDVLIRGGYNAANWDFPPNPILHESILDGGGANRVVTIASDASPTLENLTIRNGVSSQGGGISNSGGSPTIQYNTIHNNTAAGAPGTGGGIFDGGSAIIRHNEIYDNSASRGGGIVVGNDGSTPSNISHNNIHDNEAPGAANLGGGIAIQEDARALVNGNHIHNNFAGNYGGAVFNLSNAESIFSNNFFYQNTAGADDAGFGAGGAIASQANITLWHNTIVGNNAPNSEAGGISILTGTAELVNTIVASNTAASGATGIFVHANGTISATHNNIFNNSTTLNGGTLENPLPGAPRFTDLGGFDLHLTDDNPHLIDAAHNLSSVTNDVDGQIRPVGAAPDGGADEFYDPAITCYALVNDTSLFNDLQDAVDAAAPDGTVKVAGRCTGSGTEVLLITSEITLRGGYTTTNWAEVGNHPAVIDAEGGINRRGIVVNGGASTIEGLHVTGGNSGGNGHGIYLTEGANATIQNMVIYSNTTTGTQQGAVGVSSDSSGSTLRYLTVANNESDGIEFEGAGTIVNSILAGNGEAGIRGGSGHNHNVFFNNGQNSTVPLGPDSRIGDPLFADEASGDFHIGLASAAIGAASNGFNVDYEGDPRPLGNLPDAGADESSNYVAATLVPPGDQTVQRGSSALFNHTLTNVGTVSDTFNLTAASNVTWTVIFTPTSVFLEPGQSDGIVLEVQTPPNALPSTQAHTTLTATSTLNPNVTATVLDITRVTQQVGIEFTPTYSQTKEPGAEFTLDHVLANRGDFQDSFNIEVISDTFGWVTDHTTGVPNLNIDESAPVTVTIEVPQTAPAGLENVIVLKASSVFSPAFSATVTDTIIAKAVPGIRYVSASVGNDTNNNCTVRDNLPCRTIERALSQALQGDEIRVASGTYNEYDLNINASIRMSGGWVNGFEGQSADPTLTVVDAGEQGRAFLIFPGTGPTIRNMTLRNGVAVVGGAIRVEDDAIPRFSKLVFENNTAARGGALFAGEGSNLTISLSRFLGNAATLNGAALYLEGGALNMQGNLLADNAIMPNLRHPLLEQVTEELNMMAAVNGNGGGVYIQNGTVTFDNNTVDGNQATARGGALYMDTGSLSARNNIFAGNQASSSAVLHAAAGSVNLDYNLLWNNGTVPPANVSMGANTFSGDPGFLDELRRIDQFSAAFDAADPSTVAGALPRDFDNNLRPSHHAFDIGWHELGGCLAKRGETIYGGIQLAVDAGSGPATVLAHGTCYGIVERSFDGTDLTQGVILTGAFSIAGGYNAAFSNDPVANPAPTTIDPLGLGRGIFISDSAQINLTRLKIINGEAAGLGGGPAGEDAGGGIYLGTGQLTLQKVDLYTNTATLGGGLYNHAGTVIAGLHAPASRQLRAFFDIETNEYGFNTAQTGAAIYNHNGLLHIDTANIFSNTASLNGGGVANGGGQLYMANTFLHWNHASADGGGVYYSGGAEDGLLLHLTLYNNSAGSEGGGVYVDSGAVDIKSSIFQGNQAASGTSIAADPGSSPAVDYNYYYLQGANPVVGASQGPNDIHTDVTPPGLIDPAAGDFALGDSAAAIDRADPNSPVAHDFEMDLRPSNQGFDIGADEYGGCYARLNGVIYGSIQQAHDLASDGDQIDVAGYCFGTHPYDAGPGTGIVTQTVHINKNVRLLGGWDESFNSAGSDITVVDALNLGRVFYTAPGITATIENFHVVRGDASAAGMDGMGGAILLDQNSVTLLRNNIYSSTAAMGGAIFYNDAAATIADGNLIFANSASMGGGIYISNTLATTAIAHNNFIFDNQADNGGAIYLGGGGAQLWHNTLVNNTATANGGHLYLASGALDIRNNNLDGGQAASGGGAFIDSGLDSLLLDYNNWFNNSPDNTAGPGGSAGANALFAAPGYVAGEVPFQIDEASPLMDQGDPDVTLVEDFQSDIRPTHQGWDIGADEVDGCYVQNTADSSVLYGSLQYALNSANPGDTLLVDGVCLGANDQGGFSQNTYIDRDITLDGSWDSPHVTGNPATILHAQSAGRVVMVTSGISATLNSLILTEGDASGSGLGNNGGGLYNQGNVTLTSMSVVSNSAANGAGIYQAGGVITITASTIAGNTTGGNGGGLHVAGGSLLADGNYIYENSGGNGGALYLNNATATSVLNNFIYDNNASNGGGAYLNSGNSQVWFNTFYNNSANTGGGLYVNNGSPDVNSNIVHSSNGGGGIHTAAGSPAYGYNNVVDNTGGDYVGAITTRPGSDINAAPIYIDANSGDLHLLGNSPGIDVANPITTVVDHDIDGHIRPTNGGNDIGADELDLCLVRVGDELFGVLQHAIDYATTNGIDLVEVARGVCSGVHERNGTWQVAFVNANLNIQGSLRRSDFSDPDDFSQFGSLSTVVDAEGEGRALVIGPNAATAAIFNIAFINGDALANGGNGNGGGILNLSAGLPRQQGSASVRMPAPIGPETPDDVVPGSIPPTPRVAGDTGVPSLHQVWSCANDATNGGAYYGGAGTDVYFTGSRFTGHDYCATLFIIEAPDGTILDIIPTAQAPNSASNDGGGAYVGGSFECLNCLISENESGSDGGGYYNASGGDSLLQNVIFVNNFAGNGDGGGINSEGGTLTVIHNTIRDNTASDDGGGINVDAGTFLLDSSIIFTNVAQSGASGGVASPNGTFQYNNYFQNNPDQAPSGTGSISMKPIFSGFWNLVDISPEVDRGNPALPLPVDANNVIRPDGGPHQGIPNNLPDIGAIEYWKDFGCALSSPLLTQSGDPGDTFNYHFTVTNRGWPLPLPLRGYTDSLTVTISSSTFPGWSQLEGPETQIFGPIRWGESREVTLTVNIPVTATGGLVETTTLSCTSFARPDRTTLLNAVTTVNAVGGVEVGPEYDLTAFPGDILTTTHFVTNTANTSGSFLVAADSGVQFASAVLVLPDGSQVLTRTITLEPQASEVITLRIRIAETAIAGSLATPGIVAFNIDDTASTASALNRVLILDEPGSRFVDGEIGIDSTNCRDPLEPCATIAYALGEANSYDAIYLSAGVYSETVTGSAGGDMVTATVFIDKPISLIGGYSSATVYTDTVQQPITNTVVIAGGAGKRGVVVAEGITVTLNALSIEGANVNLPGGGIYNAGSNLELFGVWLRNNQASSGGGLYHVTGTLHINSTVFQNNGSGGNGAGVYLEDGAAIVENNTFDGNSAANNGALYQAGGSLDLYNNIFSNNSAADYGAVTSFGSIVNDFNLYFNSDGSIGVSNVALGGNSLTGDPLFFDSLLHLSEGSPARNGGTNTVVRNETDFENEARQQEGQIDMGADEFAAIRDFALAPQFVSSTVDPNDTAVYHFTLTNTGSLEDSYDLASVSVNTRGGGWTIELTPIQILNLGPSESAPITLTVTAGPDSISDTTTISATSQLEPSLVQTATAETNRLFQAGVDIGVSEAQAGLPGDTVLYTHHVTNTGEIADSFALAVASLPPGWSSAVEPAQTGSLSVGESAMLSVTVMIPANAPGGSSHQVEVTATSINDPGVSDTLTNTTSVTLVYSLTLAPDREISTTANSVVVLNHTVSNEGNVTDTVSLDAVSALGWDVLVTSATIMLPPFSSANVDVTVTVPAGTSGMQDTVDVTATSGGEPSVMASATDIINVIAELDVSLVPDNLALADPGEIVVHVHTLTNEGDTADSYDLSFDSELPWSVSTSAGPIALNPGASAPVMVTVTVPGGATPGASNVVTITATSITDNDVFDSALDTTRVRQTHDLTLTPAAQEQTALAGSMVVYSHTLTNTGNGPDTFGLEADSEHGWTALVTPTLLDLEASQSAQVIVTLTVPVGTEGTTDVMTVTATSVISPAYSASAIDTTIVTGTIGGEVGVSISPNNEAAVLLGDTIIYQHVVSNDGDQPDIISISAVSSQGWLSAPPPDTLLLDPGEEQMISLAVTVPNTAADGTVDFVLVTAQSGIDPNVTDSVVDTTTARQPKLFLPILNIPEAASGPTCDFVPPATGNPLGRDLIITGLDVTPGTPLPGQPTTVRVTIRNQGQTSIAFGNNFFLDFYVNREPAPFSSGDLAWGVQGEDLGAGQSVTFEGVYFFTAGSHRLYAQVDTDQSVSETNENNNVYGCVLLQTAGAQAPQPPDADSLPSPQSLPPQDSGQRPTPTPLPR